MITVFCPSTTMGSGKTVFQTTGESRFVVNCKMNPAKLLGHDIIISVAEGIIVSCGCGNEKLKIVPFPVLPP